MAGEYGVLETKGSQRIEVREAEKGGVPLAHVAVADMGQEHCDCVLVLRPSEAVQLMGILQAFVNAATQKLG